MRATSSADLAADRALQLLPAQFAALYAGSLGLVLEPVASAVAAVVEAARERGALVMIDPNVRPSLIDDRAGYLTRLERVLAHSDVVKLSVEDAAWVWPSEPPQAAARSLLRRGPRVVVLTAGREGATVFTAGHQAAVPALEADVVDTIGAGDAFGAGFLSEWLRGLSMSGAGGADGSCESAVRAAAFASRVAGMACSVRGATPPPAAAEIRR